MSNQKSNRPDLPAIVSTHQAEITAIAVPSIQKDYTRWMDRALNYISEQKDTLGPVLQTTEGALSCLSGLKKAAQMGLQIGGHYPHAYFMPKQNKAVLVVSAEGLAFVAANGPGAVLKSAPVLVEVRDGDKVKFDGAAQTVEHTFDPFDAMRNKKEITGFYSILEYKDGHKEIPYVTMTDVIRIRDNYSNYKTRDGKLMPAWAKSGPEMLRKIAMKQILKRPAAQSEGLALLADADLYDAGEDEQEQPRDISERASARLDNQTIETAPEIQDAETIEEEVVTGEPEKGSLF